MPTNVKVHLAAVGVLTALQWAMFSPNALIGLFGLPALTVWGLMGDTRHNPSRAGLHRLFTWVLATAICYGPMVATLLGIKLWPG